MKSQSFDISLARNEHSLIVRLSGEIDFAASIDLDPMLSEIVNDSDCDLLLDMAKVTFIDSEGIRLLLNLFNKVRQKDRISRIIQCSAQVMRVLKLAGIYQLLNVSTPIYTKTREQRVQPLNWQR
ncbi:MAG: STAS domain-containing protein [Armatimonadota bacterium]